ncbi:cbb3-type cytochrome c oxidase N-terminal domain-containing protein [Cesiribacter andamanensis]|uniref:Cytochrome c oxidase subunit III n=1 Tax=Cesiribacter andamanensis AMV16 TaxID=1279009 RepID=M7P1D0_9BACT|nr:cbb3-type cytochrome c oxidase N-terminal domain-containing protein [Cesiribacter andamanensis]EMR04419.1 Cytochrome c oxidase subunit III [Cesiribacter andamanensis AMV16]
MKKSSHLYTRLMAAAALGLMPLFASAQGSAPAATGGISELDLMLGFAMFLAGLIFLCTLVLLYAVIVMKKVMLAPQEAAATAAEGVQAAAKLSIWSKLTDAVPVEREAEVMTDHEYDGIRELDNNLPPWWVAMFYATIVFSVVYLAAYHVFGWAPLQDQEYEQEVLAAKLEVEAYLAAKGGALDETNVELLMDETALAEGAAVYNSYCGACHGAELQGGVGPNLADSYWLHGGDIKDVFKVIKVGVPQKGMISWQTQLSPEQIQQVASFIISKEGSNPANAKEPQGEEYKRD